MPHSMNLWKITDHSLTVVSSATLDREERLEKWIEQDPSLLGSELLIIGRQVQTGFGGRIDLLAIDRQGDLVIIELKRDRTSRDVVGQALEYASWVRNLDHEEIAAIAFKTPLKKPGLRAPEWVEAGASGDLSGARSGAIVPKEKPKENCQAFA